MKHFQLVVVGGGPAGLAAALAAWQEGLRDILVIERDHVAGGILNQCIHNGFGLHHFKEELTGPEYAHRFIEEVNKTTIQVLCDAMVLRITQEREVSYVNSNQGYQTVSADAIVLAMGCRERTRGAINTPGTRPAGVFTAGAAQRYVNIEGQMPGKRVVILGSGDIGLIMARRMTLEGAKVLACVELMPYSGGLMRNIVQCLHDYDIPLYLGHTITQIHGTNRVSGVTIAKVDQQRQPIPGTEIEFDCDTLLLSVGLVPENELTKDAGILLDARTNGPVVYENRQTTAPGIYACGNVLQVHDLVDYVTAESMLAGRSAAQEVLHPATEEEKAINVLSGEGISYTVPQRVRLNRVTGNGEIYFRVRTPMGKSQILVKSKDTIICQFAREHVAPGEMEMIKIPKVLLNQVTEEIIISVQEVSE